MEIEIHNYLSCSFRLEKEPGKWDAIVILDSTLPMSEFVDANTNRALQLVFDDISEPTTGKVAPERQHIAEALEFSASSSKLLVCCRAGQSRSAATAFIIAFELLGSNQALRLLNPKRHSPNFRVIRIADELVQRPGILNTYDDWRIERGDLRLTDCLDEIEAEYDELVRFGATDRISNS